MTFRSSIGFRPAKIRWQDWLFVLAAANFVACGLVAATIGGDALSGHSGSGHYFLNNHGRFNEVDHATFLFSQIFTAIALTFFGIAAVFRGLMKKSRRDADKALARRVRSKYRWQS